MLKIAFFTSAIASGLLTYELRPDEFYLYFCFTMISFAIILGYVLLAVSILRRVGG